MARVSHLHEMRPFLYALGMCYKGVSYLHSRHGPWQPIFGLKDGLWQLSCGIKMASKEGRGALFLAPKTMFMAAVLGLKNNVLYKKTMVAAIIRLEGGDGASLA